MLQGKLEYGDLGVNDIKNLQVGLGSADEGSEITLVLALDVLKSNNSSSLLVDDGTETGLALDDDVRDTHLAAEGREVDNELDGVNIVSDHDEGGLLRLDQGDDVIKTVLGEQGLLGIIFSILVLSSSSSGGFEAGLLLLLALGSVLVQELEQLSSSVLVEGVGELGNSRRDLEALVKDDLLALKADIFGPLDEAGEVTSGLDVLA